MSPPSDVIGRQDEWSELSAFAANSNGSTLGVVYGRRRVGKSFLLRRLAERHNGLYYQATEQDHAGSLADFGRAVSAHESGRSGLDGDARAFTSWNDAFDRRAGLVIIDEFPYLLAHSPELPSVLQRVIDEAASGARPPLQIILCGSSLSIMTRLLDGQKPLRGRASLNLFIQPFGLTEFADLWAAGDHDLALRVHALFGGSPGYRALTTGLPTSVDQLGEWLAGNVFNPAHALYREDDYLLREEPSLTDRGLYLAILGLLANGVGTQTELAGRLQRTREALTYPLLTLANAGFVTRSNDLLTDRRPALSVADPIIRFIRLITERSRPLLDERRWQPVWNRAAHTIDAKIYGPHLESMARSWARSDARLRDRGLLISRSTQVRVPDPARRATIEVDIAAVDDLTGERPILAMLGEVKWSPSGFAPDTIDRLVRARDLLAVRGFDTSRCELVLASRERPNAPANVRAVGLADLFTKK